MANKRLLPRSRSPLARSWFEIRNSADGAQVQIYNEIGAHGITADAFVNDLRALDTDRIEIRLNSPGGEVFDGIAIHHALKNHPAHVEVIVDGLAASIASVIAMAGDKVTMAKGSQMMIHEGHTVAVGAANDMRRCADLLDKTSDTIAGFYADRAGGTVAQWRERMRAETWYDAGEAVKAGLADEVAAPSRQLRASWDLSVFNFAGRAHAPAPDLSTPDEPPAEVQPAETPVSEPDADQPTWAQLVGPLLTGSNSDPVLAALREAL